MEKARLEEMKIVIRMDKAYDPDKYYILPGGYMLNNKAFDFSTCKEETDAKDGRRVTFHVCDYDYEYTENVPINKEDTLGEFQEFTVYTGESGEPEILPKEVEKITFYWSDHTKTIADERLLSSANKGMSARYMQYA